MSEHAEQSALIKHIELRGVPGLVYFAIPNGSHRHLAVAARLKAEGVKSGAPDLFFAVPRRRSFWLEMKTKGGHLSTEQDEMHAAMRAAGETVFVAYGLDEALAILESEGAIGFEVKPVSSQRDCHDSHGKRFKTLSSQQSSISAASGKRRRSHGILTNVKNPEAAKTE